jgi:hypothetical protein
VQAAAATAERIRTRRTGGPRLRRPVPAATSPSCNPSRCLPSDRVSSRWRLLQQVGSGEVGATFSPQQPVPSVDRPLTDEPPTLALRLCPLVLPRVLIVYAKICKLAMRSRKDSLVMMFFYRRASKKFMIGITPLCLVMAESAYFLISLLSWVSWIP